MTLRSAAAVLVLLFGAAPARAQEWKAGGYVEEDVRVTEGGEWERIQSALAIRLEGQPAPRLRVVADGRVLHRGEPGAQASVVGERAPVHPWRVDGDALFVEARGFGGPGGWIRIGRQTVRWGRGLVAAPASFVSPPDLEDPLRFGRPRGSEMLRVLLPLGPVKVEGIAVHSFRPALLPPVSARDALASSGVPAAESIARDPEWTIDLDLHDPLPPTTFANMPLGARATGALPFLDAELGASWYRGRSFLPEVGSATLDVDLANRTLGGDVRLVYPRLQSAGVDAAAEIPVPVLEAVGVYGEAAWIEPDGFTRATSALGADQRVTALEEPYVRGVAGIEHAANVTYVALEWSRGFFDELGKERQHDYLFAVVERRFLRDTVKLRVVAAAALDDGSRLLAPDIAWSPRDALTLSLAAYAGAGSKQSKFGGPLAGDRVVLARARASF